MEEYYLQVKRGNREGGGVQKTDEKNDLGDEIGERREREGQDGMVKGGSNSNQGTARVQLQKTNDEKEVAKGKTKDKIRRRSRERLTEGRVEGDCQQRVEESDPAATVDKLTDVAVSPECKVNTRARTSTQPGGEIWL